VLPLTMLSCGIRIANSMSNYAITFLLYILNNFCFVTAKAVMDIINRELEIPGSKSFRTAAFENEEDMVINLREIDRMKTSINPCLRGGAGNYYVRGLKFAFVKSFN